MLKKINLKKKLSREEFKQVLPGLQTRLYDLEKHVGTTVFLRS